MNATHIEEVIDRLDPAKKFKCPRCKQWVESIQYQSIHKTLVCYPCWRKIIFSNKEVLIMILVFYKDRLVDLWKKILKK